MFPIQLKLPSPIAKMKYVAAGGQEPLYGFRDVYGTKVVEIMGREVQQVLVNSFGDLIWINCDKRNIVPVEVN